MDLILIPHTHAQTTGAARPHRVISSSSTGLLSLVEYCNTFGPEAWLVLELIFASG